MSTIFMRAALQAAFCAVAIVGEPLQSKHALKVTANLLQRQRTAIPGMKQFPNEKQPPVQGHFLTNSELTPITAIACLKAKQANPAVVCENGTALAGGNEYNGLVKDINAGNYPNYADTICNSNGAYFCDPNSALSSEQQVALGIQLETLRESNVVTCGGTLNDVADPLQYQPFYLGVVIAKGWPIAQSDPESLQQFGQIVSSQWHMDKLYEGSVIPYSRCPNTAVLIILPDHSQAYLSSASCEFVCATRGGPEVVTAALVALEKGGVSAAAAAGIATAYKAISSIPPRSSISARGTGEVRAEQNANRSAPVYNFLLRALFAISIVLLVVSLVIGFLVLLITPGVLAKSRRK